MSYSKGPAHIALITFRHNSVNAEAFDSMEALLVYHLRDTSEGLAPSYGSAEHLNALERLRLALDEGIKHAKASAEREAKLDTLEHALNGNCWSPDAVYGCTEDEHTERCNDHREPRGECTACPRCERCDLEDA